MVSRKEGRFLVFERENGGVMKYDLSTHIIYGIKGKPVSGLSSQLKGMSMEDGIETFEDENYKRFLTWVSNKVKMGTSGQTFSYLIGRLSEFGYIEKYFSAGIKHISLHFRGYYDVPKGLLKILREKEGTYLTRELLKAYACFPDIMTSLFEQEYVSIDFKTVQDIATDYMGLFDGRSKFFRLVKEYNYDPIRLMKYADELEAYEGVDATPSLMHLIYDEAKMSKEMSRRYDKYPKHFLTVHRITSRNYTKLRKQFDEENFARRIKTEYEWSYKGYSIVYPKTTSEIKDEAVQQKHCVASYIDTVIAGLTDIVFLRRTKNLKKSLITLQITDGKVVQSKGAYNRAPTPKEKQIIDLYGCHLDSITTKEKLAV